MLGRVARAGLDGCARALVLRRSFASRGTEYTHTLNMPKTEFPMRTDKELQGKLHERCTRELYSWFETRPEASQPLSFLLHDGPPYANGDLHIGHALNKILKDIVNRYRVLRGHNLRFVPGWDCHGLPIELKAMVAHSSTKGNSEASWTRQTPMQIRAAARQFAEEAILKQKVDFQRWAVMGNWQHPYITMDPTYEAPQLRAFFELFKSGCVYRARRPVHWSPATGTALAEAELEYSDAHVSQACYVRFPILNPGGLAAHLAAAKVAVDDASMLIWTTTPWTLPANQAICFHEDLQYCLVRCALPSGQHTPAIVVCADRVDSVADALGARAVILCSFPGTALHQVVCAHPLVREKESPLLVGDHVTASAGTGLVHCAPGHGLEDFAVGRKHNLLVQSPVDDAGKFTGEAGFGLAGLGVLKEGSQEVLRLLGENGTLQHAYAFTHKYPYDWRSKTPVLMRATEQWFMSMDALRAPLLRALEDVVFTPRSGRPRLESMIRMRSDWCLSRQRLWGVPIPVFYDSQTGEPILNETTIAHIEALVAKHGTDAWWSLSLQELLPPAMRSDGRTYVRGADTMDVWFDSGLSWRSVLQRRDDQTFPASMVLEGSDQHRGWFQSALVTSVALTGRAPYKEIVTHGFSLDASGAKMSKSAGNTISPAQILDGGKNKQAQPAFPVDVLRLWVAASDFSRDVTLSYDMLGKLSETHRKVRNTARFIVGTTADFDPLATPIPFARLALVDQYLLARCREFAASVTKAYDAHSFCQVISLVNEFASADVSSLYFEACKDRLYLPLPDAPTRRAVQTVLVEVLDKLVKAVAPVLVHTAEEIHHYASTQRCASAGTAPASIFTTGWMRPLDDVPDGEFSARHWDGLRQVRHEVHAVGELLRKQKKIGSLLEAEVAIQCTRDHPLFELFAALAARQELRDLFQASQTQLVEAHDSTQLYAPAAPRDGASPHVPPSNDFTESQTVDLLGHPLRVVLRRADGAKCPRCWKYCVAVPPAATPVPLCATCASVVAELSRSV